MATLSRQGRGSAPQLSCDLCRERKVKCDKLDPCTGCTAAGVICKPIFRDRLPRGRHAKKSAARSGLSSPRAAGRAKKQAVVATTEASDQELRKRVESLECLIQNMANQGITSSTVNDTTRSQQSGQSHLDNPDGGFPMTVQPPHDDDPGLCSYTMTQSASDGGVLAALGIGSPFRPCVVGQQTSASLDMADVRRLVNVYFAHIDPILKILHRPSIERWLSHGERYLEYSDCHQSAQALQHSICYIAASSMTDQQCQSLLGRSKFSVAEDLCRTCETSLGIAKLICTNDITVLQAFVLFLFARKSFDVSTSTWTLVSVAVRLGEKLRLYDSTDTDSFFEAQTKKRLWLTICMLDYQAALSQRSEPLINHEKVRDVLAQSRHINDADFGPLSTTASDREDLTDMTFAYVLFHHQLTGRLLNFATSSEEESNEKRQQHAREFEEKALGVLRFCDPESSQLAWLTWHATQCHVAIIRVSRLRPLCKSLSTSDSQTRRPQQDHELLRMTLRVLEKTQLIHTDARGEPFRWYATMPWPMLATAISACGLCTDANLVLRGWPVLKWWYQQHETLIALSDDPSRGVLASAMQRASTKVAALSSSQQVTEVSSNETNAPTSLAETSTYMGLANPEVVLDEQNTDLDINLYSSLQVFDSLPWFADSTSSELDAIFFNDWDFSHIVLE